MLFYTRSILVFAIILQSLTSTSQSKGFFHTKGKDIIAPDGKPFLIKGTNLGNWLVPEGYMFNLGDVSSPRLINQVFAELIGPAKAAHFWKEFLDNYITEEDIHYLKSIGVNSIRLPFNYRLFSREYYMGASDSLRGFIYMDRLITWCKKENIYILLDMHCAPGGQTGDNIDDGYGFPFLFDNEDDINQTVTIWKNIASRYKNEKIIMGYDLLNEPVAHYFDKEHFNPLLEPVYKRITMAIREVDKNHTVYLGGAQWDSNFQPFGAPFDNNIVYTFHKYWTPPTKEVIQDYIDLREKFNVPIYVGETGENTDGWVDSFRVVCEQNNVGWHFWPYKKMENTRGFVSFGQPAGYDSVISYAGKIRTTFSDQRAARPKAINDINKSFDLLLQNIRFKNCIANEGYIKALGLNFKKIK